MGSDRPETEGSGTWGSREAAAEWRRGAAARLAALGPATETMLDLAGVRRGSRVLDLGAGAGDTSLMAARRAGPTGYVLATDISANMLEIAAESAAQDGLTNLSTRVADAQHLDLAADSFDAAISRNCLMLIPDHGQALTEIRRVLKPSGRFAAIVYSTPDRCPYFAIPHAIAFRLGRLTAPRLEEFGEFRLGGPGRPPGGVLVVRLPRGDSAHSFHPPSFSLPLRRHAVRPGAAAIARAHDATQPERTGSGLGRDRGRPRAVRRPDRLRLSV